MPRDPGSQSRRALSSVRRTALRFLRIRRTSDHDQVPSHDMALQVLRRLDACSTAFNHMDFEEFDLHAALEGYLGRPIGYELIPDHNSALVRRVVRRETIHAELVYAPSSEVLSIHIAASLHPGDRKEAHYQELAHLIAAHPVPYHVPGKPPEHREFWTPAPALCRSEPPFDLARCKTDPDLRRSMIIWCESNADAWVEHLRTISAMGRQVYLREERVIGL